MHPVYKAVNCQQDSFLLGRGFRTGRINHNSTPEVLLHLYLRTTGSIQKSQGHMIDSNRRIFMWKCIIPSVDISRSVLYRANCIFPLITGCQISSLYNTTTGETNAIEISGSRLLLPKRRSAAREASAGGTVATCSVRNIVCAHRLIHHHAFLLSSWGQEAPSCARRAC